MVPPEEVQVLVDERRESPGIGVRNGVSIGLQLAQYRIHVARVPEHDRIDVEALDSLGSFSIHPCQAR